MCKSVFTICSNNYLAQAKTLADSFLEFNKGYKFYIFLCDTMRSDIDYSKFDKIVLRTHMNRNILSLDFYGGEIIAALAAQDDDTDTLRIRHLLRRPSRAFAGAFVRDMRGAQEELTRIFADIAQYVSFDPLVVVGLRGSFLSFKHSNGFESVNARNRIIGEREMEAAAKNSVPTSLSDTLDIVDILPLSYSIDGNTDIKNPKGMSGFKLGAETFISYGLVTHLNNLNHVFTAANCTGICDT